MRRWGWVGVGLWLWGLLGLAGRGRAEEGRTLPNPLPAHLEPAEVATNRLPRQWRFRADPQDLGEVDPSCRYFDPAYEDSPWEKVEATFPWKGDGAAWYRGDLWWEPVGRTPLLIGPIPGLGAASATVYVNGTRLQPQKGQSLREAVRAALVRGYNLVAIKVERWPNALPPPSGPEIGEVTWRFDGNGDPGSLTITQAEVRGNSRRPVGVRLRLLNPQGRVVAAAEYPPLHLPTRLTDPLRAELQELGRYRLELTVGKQTRRWTFHSLGLALLNGGATDRPVDLDPLLARVATEDRRHHALSLLAWLLEPSSQAAGPLARLREALAAGRLDFVAGGYGPCSVGEADGETLVRNLRYGRALVQSQLGVETPYFWSYDGSLSPRLPQLLRLGGYETCIRGGWAGRADLPEVSWSSPDGSSLRLWAGPSPYLPLRETVRRAVRQGRKVALALGTPCWEAADVAALAQEGIFLQRVSLAEYLAASRGLPVLRGDGPTAYPGWSGGTPPEVAAERAYRLAAVHLVAADNLLAAAGLWGLSSQGSPEEMDQLWRACLLSGGAHPSNGTGAQVAVDRLSAVQARAQEIIRAVAAALAQRVRRDREAVVVVNPLGWNRSGWVHVRIGEGPAFLATPNGVLTQQRMGEEDLLFWAEDVPAVGWRTYKLLRLPQALGSEGPQVQVQSWGMDYLLQNPYLRVAVSPDGRLSLQPRSRPPRTAQLNQLWVMKPASKRPEAPLSTARRPLNLDHYNTLPLGRMDLLESGPARATVRVVTALPGCSGASVEQRISLAAGARRVEVELSLYFPEAQAVGDPRFPAGSSGPYLPGLFVAFPCSRRADLVVDQAYCLVHQALRRVYYGAFPRLPFQHFTGRGLSLAAPDSGEFALLTHGLTHFFLIPDQGQQLLGLSLGTGFGPSGEVPYQGHYVLRYALFLPDPQGSQGEAYRQAQEAQVPLQGIVMEGGGGDLPEAMSCFSTGDPAAPITGVQFRDGRLAVRLIDLAERRRSLLFQCSFPLDGVTLAPTGEAPPTLGGTVRIDLLPGAVLEIQAQLGGAT